MSIHGFTRTLELISKEISGEIQVTTILTFLFVAQRGKCTQKDVELELGVSNASASRNVSFWTDRRYDREEGLKFIERVEGNYDRRFKELTLTQKGKAFYKKIMEAASA